MWGKVFICATVVNVTLSRNVFVFRWMCGSVHSQYQFHDVSVMFSPYGHSVNCTLSLFSTQQTTRLTLIMIPASKVPGLLHVIALTGNKLHCWVEDWHTHKPTIQTVTKKSLQQDEGHLPLVPYCTNLLSSPTDCTWTYLPQHPDQPALPQHLNIVIRLEPRQCLRIHKYSQLQNL